MQVSLFFFSEKPSQKKIIPISVSLAATAVLIIIVTVVWYMRRKKVSQGEENLLSDEIYLEISPPLPERDVSVGSAHITQLHLSLI